MTDIMFDVSFEARGLLWQVKRVEDCESLATEKTHNAWSGEDSQKDDLRRAGESAVASVVHYKKTNPSVLCGLMLSTAFDTSFYLRRCFS